MLLDRQTACVCRRQLICADRTYSGHVQARAQHVYALRHSTIFQAPLYTWPSLASITNSPHSQECTPKHQKQQYGSIQTAVDHLSPPLLPMLPRYEDVVNAGQLDEDTPPMEDDPPGPDRLPGKDGDVERQMASAR